MNSFQLALIISLALASLSVFAASNQPLKVSCEVYTAIHQDEITLPPVHQGTIHLVQGSKNFMDKNILVTGNSDANVVMIHAEIREDKLRLEIDAEDSKDQELIDVTNKHPLEKGDVTSIAYVTQKVERTPKPLLDRVSIECAIE